LTALQGTPGARRPLSCQHGLGTLAIKAPGYTRVADTRSFAALSPAGRCPLAQAFVPERLPVGPATGWRQDLQSG
jgi:hypothetical protein